MKQPILVHEGKLYGSADYDGINFTSTPIVEDSVERVTIKVLEALRTIGGPYYIEGPLEKIPDGLYHIEAEFEVVPDHEYKESGLSINYYHREVLRLVEKEPTEESQEELIDAVRDLLAVLHRDGGHYTEEHGLIKSTKDAQELLHKKWICTNWG